MVGNMAEVDRRLTANFNKLQVFKIAKVEGSSSLEVRFDDDVKFGDLDVRSSQAIDAMPGRHELEIQGQAETDAIRNVAYKAQKEALAVIRVNIHISGPVSLSEEVGAELMRHRAWLQRPLAPRHPYHNPQHIVFPGIDVEYLQYHVEADGLGVKDEKQSNEGFQKTIAEVYDTLTRDKSLNKIEGDIGLRTHLKE